MPPEEPTIPEWAMPPMSELEKNLIPPSLITLGNSINSLALFNSMNSSQNLPANFISPKAVKNTYFFEIFPFHRNIVTERAEQIGHHRRLTMKPLIVYLPPNAQTGFTVTYSILIEELPNPITGELKVRWEQSK